MFEPTSRYYLMEKATMTDSDGRVVTYIRRRFLPQGELLPLLAKVTVNEGDRLDLISARTIGDSEQFWRVCDANNAMNPFHLTAEPGDILSIPVPQIEGPR